MSIGVLVSYPIPQAERQFGRRQPGTSLTDTIHALAQREIACLHKSPPEIPNKVFTTAPAATTQQKKQSYPSSETFSKFTNVSSQKAPMMR